MLKAFIKIAEYKFTNTKIRRKNFWEEKKYKKKLFMKIMKIIKF